MFDKSVPLNLKHVQEWFGNHICRPIDRDSRMPTLSLSGRPIAQEAREYLLDGPQLKAEERLEIYSQQYWWRLLKVMHDSFPFLIRLFGYTSFNQDIAMPYLTACPSDDWSLATLGSRLVVWLKENYHESDRDLVLMAASIDSGYNAAFIARQDPFPNPEDPEIFSKVFFLQPHVLLFDLDDDLFSVRKEFLKEEPQVWLEKPFPPMPEEGRCFFVLYRDCQLNIRPERISEEEFSLLELFDQGTTLEEFLDHVEEDKIQQWLSRWMVKGWLC